MTSNDPGTGGSSEPTPAPEDRGTATTPITDPEAPRTEPIAETGTVSQAVPVGTENAAEPDKKGIAHTWSNNPGLRVAAYVIGILAIFFIGFGVGTVTSFNGHDRHHGHHHQFDQRGPGAGRGPGGFGPGGYPGGPGEWSQRGGQRQMPGQQMPGGQLPGQQQMPGQTTAPTSTSQAPA